MKYGNFAEFNSAWRFIAMQDHFLCTAAVAAKSGLLPRIFYVGGNPF
jgi:hypothetical protein